MSSEKKSIGEIRKEFENVQKEAQTEKQQKALDALCLKYAQDGRKGVQVLIERCYKQKEKLQKERERLDVMRQFERQYADCTYICGIDEAGRGPLAGPVVAGAVILPKDCEILYLNDSKQLSASPARIDEINILQATYEAMREAVRALGVVPDVLLNDAVRIPGLDVPQVPIVKGDAKSVSIAAASILAKVTRDRLMIQYEEVLPGYGFAKNKGYGSADHIAALKQMGATPIHRQSFIKNFV